MKFKVVYYKDEGDALPLEEVLDAQAFLNIPDDRVVSSSPVEDADT